MWPSRALMFLLILKLIDAYSEWTPDPVTGDVGSRLILTPYIESGNVTEARNLSLVSGEPFNDGIVSYSGFLTVNETYNSNLFFWFFPSKHRYEEVPLIMWLQGGPGSSSLLGLFKEIGPYAIGENLTLAENPYSWYNNHSLLFIDNPMGTGFSFTENEAGFATEEEQVGNELYSALIQFLTMFPELQNVPFYAAGESYGGKHAPAIAYTIHQRNPSAKLKVNLKGIAVGNGFTDPISILHYSEYVHQLGLVDTKASEEMAALEPKGRKAIQDGNYYLAYTIFREILDIFYEHSKFNNPYNFLESDMPSNIGEYATLVQQPAARKALHVGDAEYSSIWNVFQMMSQDFMNSVRPWLEVLIDNYRVVYYNGQMDIIVAYPMSVRMFNALQFGAAAEYKNATRVPWYVDGQLAGYIKSAGNFTEVLVRKSGHMVPMDQPKWAFDLINRFTSNTFPSGSV